MGVGVAGFAGQPDEMVGTLVEPALAEHNLEKVCDAYSATG